MTRAARLMDGCALACLLLGESFGGIIARGWVVGPFTAFFVSGVALFIVRHLIWPSPSLPFLLWSRARQSWSQRATRAVWSIALGSRLLVLAVGVVAAASVPPRSFSLWVSADPVENLPARFDAGWYLGIARHGYDWAPDLEGRQHSLAFFPGYPALMRVGGDLVTVPAKVLQRPDLFGNGNTRVLWGGVLVSLLCFGAALLHVFRLGTLETHSETAALRGAVLLAAYPFALFFSAPYSESLFLLCCSGAVLAWFRAQPGKATAWGLAAGLSRSNGWTLGAALLVHMILRRREHPPRVWALAALSPLAGAAAYSLYVYALTGNPLEWMSAQEGWGRRVDPLSFVTRPWEAVQRSGFWTFVAEQPVEAATLLATILAVAVSAIHLWKGRWLYSVFIAAYLMPAVAIDLPATGRMTSVLFPVFLFLGERVNAWAFGVLTCLFLAGQIYFARQFFLWRPPF